MGDKHLSEVINYQRDIEPYRFIKIYSGVGSGKSTFACRFVTGCDKDGEEVPKLTTLIITSRRAKVEETLTEMGVAIKDYAGQRGNLETQVFETGEQRPEQYEEYVRIIPTDSEFCGDIVTHNMSVVCTNAYIENHLRYSYVPGDPSTHLWNLFDVIIIDEVHSLITDATYQSAPFAVLELMKEYVRLCTTSEDRKPRCKHFVVMTGSPEPFESCVDLSVPNGLGKEYSVFDVCKNVTPQKVVVLNAEAAAHRLRKLLYDGDKVIYFTNHTMTKKQAVRKWHLTEEINVAVSFSSEEKRKVLTEDEKSGMEYVEGALKTGELPSEIQLFVTTSRNKEGINIKNKDIKHLFVETHFSSDVIQMVGRAREGVEFLYIITDEKQLCEGEDCLDSGFTKKYILDEPDTYGDANVHLVEICRLNKAEQLPFNKKAHANAFGTEHKETVGAYIEYIEKKFPYVRYSFIDNCFKFYQQKADAENLIFNETEAFNKAVYSGADKVFELIRAWFPEARTRFWLAPQERAIEYLDTYLGEEGHRVLSPKEWDELFARLSEISETTYKNPQSLLTWLGKYTITEPIGRRWGVKAGSLVLYKGETNPLEELFVKKRNPGKRAKSSGKPSRK